MLGELGFRVIFEENADRRTLRRAIREFSAELRGGGVGLFYFAGHGMQVDGLNYLIPIEQLFKRVRVGVQRQTNGQQVPWEESSLVSDFFFVPDGEADDPNATLALRPATAVMTSAAAAAAFPVTPPPPVAVTVRVDQTSIVPVCHPPIDIFRRGLRKANRDVAMILEIDGEQLTEIGTSFTKKVKEPIWTGELAPGEHEVTLKVDYKRKSLGLVDREVSQRVAINSNGTLVLKVHHDTVVIEERGFPFSDKKGMTPEVVASFVTD